MKANELMIGDWVRIANPYAPCRGQVVAILDDMIQFVFDMQDDEFNTHIMEAEIEELQPIPITEEILEKNFIKDKLKNGEPQWVYYTDYTELRISEFSDGIFEVLVDDVEMSGLPTWLMYVCNVHQLQHALRLCGIEKEIEL